MTIAIDKVRTGQQIRLLMGVARAPRPQAPRAPRTEMDMLVYGNRRYDPNKNIPEGAERLFRYYRLIQECMAA